MSSSCAVFVSNVKGFSFGVSCLARVPKLCGKTWYRRKRDRERERVGGSEKRARERESKREPEREKVRAADGARVEQLSGKITNVNPSMINATSHAFHGEYRRTAKASFAQTL